MSNILFALNTPKLSASLPSKLYFSPSRLVVYSLVVNFKKLGYSISADFFVLTDFCITDGKYFIFIEYIFLNKSYSLLVTLSNISLSNISLFSLINLK